MVDFFGTFFDPFFGTFFETTEAAVTEVAWTITFETNQATSGDLIVSVTDAFLAVTTTSADLVVL